MKKLLIKTNNEIDEFIKVKLNKLHTWAKLPIGVGLTASIIYIYLFSFMKYLENFLEWIIGATMVIIVVEYLTRNGKNNTEKQEINGEK